MKEKLREWLGLERQSKYVRDYFYAANMRASIYMSVVVIVLELYMIYYMSTKVILTPITGEAFWHVVDKYFTNYFILLASGILMLLYALRFLYQKYWVKWLSILTLGLAGSVCIYEIRCLVRAGGEGTALQNRILLLAAGFLLIAFSVMLFTGRQDVRWQSLGVLYTFSVVCIDFGIIIATGSYAAGEQVLAFLTMVLFVVCLLTWRPVVGFCILTASYAILYYRLDPLPAPNTGEPGLTESSVINGFTMWLSTLLFCISNYRKTRSQALKDENLEEINAHLRRISVIDELTGIHNMFWFRTEAEKVMNYVTTDVANTVFLFFDIENFKSYNEKYGFHEGNQLLIHMAHHIEEAFAGSLVSRFSDDHFVVLTKQEGSMERISSLSEKLRDLQGEVQLTLKCGAYKPDGHEKDTSLACDRARFACNSIKKHYDLTFRMYDHELEQRFMMKQYIVNNIDHAIENGYIQVYYQPIVSTASGCICGLEALARWQDPEYGLLPPSAFIGVLEEYRQIYKLDRCIIEQVCRDYRNAADAGRPFVPVSLNFSRLDFELCDIVGNLCALADKYRVPRKFLEVEITESALTDQQDFLPSAMKALRRNGYSIWLDDFGSGYSSLNVLKDYQFDVLKIDMKFLSGFGQNEKTQPILENIVSLTEQLHMLSLTEGVETQEQFDFLKSIGCSRAQGYLFSKPIPGEQLWKLVEEGRLDVEPEYRSVNNQA